MILLLDTRLLLWAAGEPERLPETARARAAHAVAVAALPPLHRDPFDRLLVARAQVEGITLMTSDAAVAAYPGPILVV